MKIKQVRRIVRDLRKTNLNQWDSHAQAVVPQDTLEFAAMLLGTKPVFLLGRGFEDAAWTAGVRRIAQVHRLEVAEDTFWNVDYSKLALPAWYRDLKSSRETAIYITPSKETASEVRTVSARGWVLPAEEARLLGYPRCCVEGSHNERLTTAEIFFRAAMRAAEGDEDRARSMILADEKFAIEGEDAVRMRAATQYRPCPFTSVFMCASCAANDRSPARTLSRRYATLARDLDSNLFAALEQTARLMMQVANR
jgi:hypothetical protein